MYEMSKQSYQECSAEERESIEIDTKWIVLDLLRSVNYQTVLKGSTSCISKFEFDKHSFVSGRFWYVDDRLETREVTWKLSPNNDPYEDRLYDCEFAEVLE